MFSEKEFINGCIDFLSCYNYSTDEEIKKDINFTMSSTDSIHVTRRKVAKSKPKELQKTADELSPAEKMDAYENDFSDVPVDVLKDNPV